MVQLTIMSLAAKIGKNTLIKYIQSIFGIFLGAASGYLMLRYLSVREYGLFTLAISFALAILPWIDFGLSQVVVSDAAGYLGSGEKNKMKRLFLDFASLKICLGATVAVVGLIITFFLKYDANILFLVRLSAAFLFIQCLRSVFITFFESFSKFFYSAVLNLVELVFKLGAIIFFIIFMKMQAEGIILSYIVSASLAIIFTIPFFIKLATHLRGIAVSSEPIFKKLIFGHGKFQALTQPLKVLFDNFQIWFLGSYLGVATTAIYRLANQLFNYVSVLLGASESVLFPIFSEEIDLEYAKARFIVSKTSKYLLWLSLPIMAAGFFVIPFVVQFLFGDKYVGLLPIFYVMLISLPMMALGTSLRPVFFAIKDQKTIFKTTVLTYLIAYPPAIVAAYLWGLMGFSIIIPISAFVSLLLRAWYLGKRLNGRIFTLKIFFVFDEYDKKLLQKIYFVFRNKIFGRNNAISQ